MDKSLEKPFFGAILKGFHIIDNCSAGEQSSVIKFLSSSNTFLGEWGVARCTLKWLNSSAALLNLTFGPGLVDDCASCAVIAVGPLGLHVHSVSQAPLGSAADWYSSLKNGSGYIGYGGTPTSFYLHSSRDPCCMSVHPERTLRVFFYALYSSKHL